MDLPTADRSYAARQTWIAHEHQGQVNLVDFVVGHVVAAETQKSYHPWLIKDWLNGCHVARTHQRSQSNPGGGVPGSPGRNGSSLCCRLSPIRSGRARRSERSLGPAGCTRWIGFTCRPVRCPQVPTGACPQVPTGARHFCPQVPDTSAKCAKRIQYQGILSHFGCAMFGLCAPVVDLAWASRNDHRTSRGNLRRRVLLVVEGDLGHEKMKTLPRRRSRP
jgi:hypothetical protein